MKYKIGKTVLTVFRTGMKINSAVLENSNWALNLTRFFCYKTVKEKRLKDHVKYDMPESFKADSNK